MDVTLDVHTVFGFFAEATNLQIITPPELCFRVLTPEPIEMRQGTVIDYRLRLYSMPFRWQAKITHWDPPHRFVDEQTRGPYKKWIHTHRFSVHDGLTTIADKVSYRLPLWPMGEIFYPVVCSQLRRIFHFRQQAVRDSLGVGSR